MDFEEPKNSFEANETTDNSSFSPVPPEKSEKLADNYEPIDIKGQQETGVWVHHPGSEVSQRWEPRKGKSRRLDTEIHGEPNDSVGSGNSTVSGSLNNDSSSPDNNHEEKHRMRLVRKGLHKIGSVFHRSPVGEELLSPHDNISSFQTGKVQAEGGSTEGSSPESPASAKGNVKDMAKNILKHAEKSARGLRHVLSCKSRKFKDESPTVPEIEHESDSSDQESVAAQSPIDVIRTPVGSPAVVSGSNGSPNSGVNVVQIVPSNTNVDNQATTEIANEKDDPENTCSSDRYREEFVKSAELEHDKEEMGADKKDSISLSQ